MARTPLRFALLALLLLGAFVLDLMVGAMSISAEQVARVLLGLGGEDTSSYIILNLRLPKALTALTAGAGMALAGLQMQSLFNNPLADTSILGINSGAGVGVALYTMLSALMPALGLPSAGGSSWGMITAACLGAGAILLLIAVVASRVQSMVSVLLVGVMLGFLASAVISVLQFFSSEEMLKTYLLWSFGSISGTTWGQLQLMLPLVGFALCLSLLLPKAMNALSLGESYARSVGVDVRSVRFALIALTSVLSGGITAFTGPIAFLGLAVPHFVRLLFGTSDHRTLIPATILSGALLLLLCDIFTQLIGGGLSLPINALTSLIGAPVVIYIILRRQGAPRTL